MSNFKMYIIGIWYLIAFASVLSIVFNIVYFDKVGLKMSLFLLVMSIVTVHALWERDKENKY